MHRAARDDARRLDLDAGALDVLERPLAVDGIAQGVDHPAEQALAHRHVDDGARALDDVAFLDAAVFAEQHDADVVHLQVQGHAHDAAGKFHQLAGLHVVQAMDAGDVVTDGEDLPDLQQDLTCQQLQ